MRAVYLMSIMLALALSFTCKAQNNHRSNHTAMAPTHTFQLVIPTAKYLDMYDVLVTDSLLEVIEMKRQHAKDVMLPLNLDMNILILSKTKVEQGIRVPKIEIVRHH